ncbi:farnesol dehydrogenase-like [Arctopsyche grandis]|uniref:farnesol dehydrogenase-like n=1 Tax=Arctopsyche grandis TaxID=121162 RepID=UPI00406D94DC
MSDDDRNRRRSSRLTCTSTMYLKFLLVWLTAAVNAAEWRWNEKVVVVTGASGSIGSITALTLADKGMMVVGLARRVERIEELSSKTKGRLCPYKCDLTKEDDIKRAFEWIERTFGGVDVIINNAGVYIPGSLINGSSDDWRMALDVNILGMGLVTKEALKSMRNRGDNGHIININSAAGHAVSQFPDPIGMYAPSKFAVTAYTEALRLELSDLDSKIKVTSISPGSVKYVDSLSSKPAEPSDGAIPYLQPKDIAEAIVYALSTRPGVQVHELTIQATGSSVCV